MKEYETLVVDDQTIRFTLERRANRQRTVAIKVSRAGQVRVLTPPRMPMAAVREFVSNKALWIAKHTAAAEQRGEKRLFVTGETVPYLGRELLLIIKPADIKRARCPVFKDGVLTAQVPAATVGEERTEFVTRCLRLWYRPRAEKRLCATALELAGRTGHEPAAVKVKDLKSSWGVCRGDNISLNWRLVLAPPALMEYVVYHELCHLLHRGHGQDFWRALSEFVPDYKERRRALNDIDLDWI